MKKILIILLLSFISAHATINLSGNWYSGSKTNNNRTILSERETIYLNSNGTFNLTLLASAKNGNNYMNDLKITASGIWKERNSIVVFVLKKFYVTNPTRMNGISQQSLNNMISGFRSRYGKDMIIINTLKSTNNGMSLTNSSGRTTYYNR